MMTALKEARAVANEIAEVLAEHGFDRKMLDKRSPPYSELLALPYPSDTPELMPMAREVLGLQRRVSDMEYIVYGLLGFIILLALFSRR